MSSKKGPRGGGPMAGPPPGPSSCLFPAPGCWPLTLSGGSFSLICHLGPNITETTPSRPGLHAQWLVLLPLEEPAVYLSLSYSNRFTKSVNILLCEVRGTISKCLMGNGLSLDPWELFDLEGSPGPSGQGQSPPWGESPLQASVSCGTRWNLAVSAMFSLCTHEVPSWALVF